MKALVITRFGGLEVLELQQVPDAHPAPEQVLVKVEAGGLNFADLMTMDGGYANTPKPPLTARREFAGIDENPVAHRNLVCPAAENWTFDQGAAFPVNFFTAYFVYWKAGLLAPSLVPTNEKPAGSRALIHAVAGGVGTAAVQIGKILG